MRFFYFYSLLKHSLEWLNNFSHTNEASLSPILASQIFHTKQVRLCWSVGKTENNISASPGTFLVKTQDGKLKDCKLSTSSFSILFFYFVSHLLELTFHHVGSHLGDMSVTVVSWLANRHWPNWSRLLATRQMITVLRTLDCTNVMSRDEKCKAWRTKTWTSMSCLTELSGWASYQAYHLLITMVKGLAGRHLANHLYWQCISSTLAHEWLTVSKKFLHWQALDKTLGCERHSLKKCYLFLSWRTHTHIELWMGKRTTKFKV